MKCPNCKSAIVCKEAHLNDLIEEINQLRKDFLLLKRDMNINEIKNLTTEVKKLREVDLVNEIIPATSLVLKRHFLAIKELIRGK